MSVALHQFQPFPPSHLQSSNEASLRPSLGHPSQREQLERLCAKEQERHARCLRDIQSHAHSLRVRYCMVLVVNSGLILRFGTGSEFNSGSYGNVPTGE